MGVPRNISIYTERIILTILRIILLAALCGLGIVRITPTNKPIIVPKIVLIMEI